MPCQPNFYISYNNDTCFVRASRMLLIWLKDSCQDYYRRVNMSHSDSTPMFLCSFSFESSSTESEEGTVFILRFFSFLVPRGKGLTLQYWRQHSIFPICPGIRQQREDIVCHMLEITSKREIKSEYGHNLKKKSTYHCIQYGSLTKSIWIYNCDPLSSMWQHRFVLFISTLFKQSKKPRVSCPAVNN